MRLHVAFRYGARLGNTHGRHGVRTTPRRWRLVPLPRLPTQIYGVNGRVAQHRWPGEHRRGRPTSTALALDLQARGEASFAPVRKACREDGIGNLLCLSSPVSQLPENTESFTATAEQICRTWFETQLPDGARTGRHAIFLSGPVAITVALGARLASADHGRWTAYTYDAANNTYERFPPLIST
ncbi:SAVED domain-containing protein [Actinomadura latina]|uniref:SAVED domain-containing protein n=1 Tax=Actinomadura latina TaxID=163603 RepID=UPI0024808BB4|nr:SAVED domain-containing protein [Actinomadura latina]